MEPTPPGPAQAAFNGLVPGKLYNIRVASEGQVSEPSTAQYRTVPLRPHNGTIENVGSKSLTVSWSAPQGISEFDRYQVAIRSRRKTPQIIGRGEKLEATVTDLQPNRTYTVVIKTVSGSVASWPAVINVTTSIVPQGFLDFHFGAN